MSKEFMNLSEEYKNFYQNNIDQMLRTISIDDEFDVNIQNLCKQALNNNWDLSKKINIINIITQ